MKSELIKKYYRKWFLSDYEYLTALYEANYKLKENINLITK
jgi:hypothetical protein